MVSKATSAVRSCSAQPCRGEACRYPASQSSNNGIGGGQEGGSSDAHERTKTLRQLLKEAVTDEKGLGDIAYISIFMLTAAAIASLTHILLMATIDYYLCWRSIEKITGPLAVCSFDPLPTGKAAGLVFAAFATLIGALAGYVVATRRKQQ